MTVSDKVTILCVHLLVSEFVNVYLGFRKRGSHKSENTSRYAWTLASCLTTAADIKMTINFSADLYKKTHCCRPKQSKFWANSHTVPHHACVKFGSFQHLNFDLTSNLMVANFTPHMIYFLLVFNSNMWPNSAPLRDISLRNLSDLDIDLQRL